MRITVMHSVLKDGAWPWECVVLCIVPFSGGTSRAIGHAVPGSRWCSRRPDVS